MREVPKPGVWLVCWGVEGRVEFEGRVGGDSMMKWKEWARLEV